MWQVYSHLCIFTNLNPVSLKLETNQRTPSHVSSPHPQTHPGFWLSPGLIRPSSQLRCHSKPFSPLRASSPLQGQQTHPYSFFGSTGPRKTTALQTPKSNSPLDKGDDGEPRSLRLRTLASTPRGLCPPGLWTNGSFSISFFWLWTTFPRSLGDLVNFSRKLFSVHLGGGRE